jgi:hypothetical protein
VLWGMPEALENSRAESPNSPKTSFNVSRRLSSDWKAALITLSTFGILLDNALQILVLLGYAVSERAKP